MKPAAFLAPPVRCLIVDEMHESLLPLLTEIGVFGHYKPQLTADEVPGALAAGGYEGLIVRSKLFVSAELVASLPRLRFVCRAGAGTDNLDEEALAAAGILVINAPEGNRDAVGEFAVGLLLSLLRHIPRAHAEVQRGEWHREANRGTEPDRPYRRHRRFWPHGRGIRPAAARVWLSGACFTIWHRRKLTFRWPSPSCCRFCKRGPMLSASTSRSPALPAGWWMPLGWRAARACAGCSIPPAAK